MNESLTALRGSVLNQNKTVLMKFLFTGSSNHDNPHITIRNEVIGTKPSHSFVGITWDSNLCFRELIDKICDKIYR